VTRVVRILGVLAVVCFASCAFANTISCSTTAPTVITLYCSSVGATGLNTQGQFNTLPVLDTINWGANAPDDTNTGHTGFFYNPDYFGPDTSEPGDVGGVNGTSYSFGQYGQGADSTLTTSTGAYYGMTGTVLTGSAIGNSGLGGFAMGFDTQTTNPVNGITGLNPNPPAITGLGFDVQLGNGTNQASNYTVTFDIYSAGSGCGDYPYQGKDPNFLSPDVSCWNYSTGAPVPGSGSTLIGKITLTSIDGSEGFFGFNTTANVQTVAVESATTQGSEGNSTFGFGSVTLTESLVPEPATLLLFGSGMLAVARRMRKRMTK
jgi:hypothetical protein